MSVKLASYGLITTAGSGMGPLWERACKAEGLSEDPCLRIENMPEDAPKAFLFPKELRKSENYRNLAKQSFENCFSQMKIQGLSTRIGIIVASTKGCLEDFVWSEETPRETDPLSPILEDIESFLSKRQYVFAEKACVSNACTSGLSAVYLAKEWIDQERVDDVIIFSCDFVGPFIARGFSTLRALSPDGLRPFSFDRKGLALGDAAATLWLSKNYGEITVESVSLDAEGVSATRPSTDGNSLLNCYKQLKLSENANIGAVLAHGTATYANDLAESAALANFEALHKGSIECVTASKALVGHSLGASSAIDLCLAHKILQSRKVFPIANTKNIDPLFTNTFCLKERKLKTSRVLVSSLGFGGIHGACSLTL